VQLDAAVVVVPPLVTTTPPSHLLVVVIVSSLVDSTVPLLEVVHLVPVPQVPDLPPILRLSAQAHNPLKVASLLRVAKLGVVDPPSLALSHNLHLKFPHRSSLEVIPLEIVQIVPRMR
jgi:hypothetical protein